MEPGIVVHGGAGAPREWDDGCRAAAERGMAVLRQGGSALEAAVAAAVSLEDDGRFNAGSGSVLRLDGKTVEMDASVMDSEGRLGAVAALRGFKNPIRAAVEVAKTPHVLLCGEGAGLFAKARGLEPGGEPSPRARERAEAMRRAFAEGGDMVPVRWRGFDLKAGWNFPEPVGEWLCCDTIGAVARDSRGRLAAANSTGGATPMLLGRVGDSPLLGCGFYCGEAAAVAATGIGEEIIRRLFSKDVYDRIAAGTGVQEACEAAVAVFPAEHPVGVIAVSPSGTGAASNRDMARAGFEHG